MATEIAIRPPEHEVLGSMYNWLRENVGPGSHRTIKNSFMGMDDWFSYDNVPDDHDEERDGICLIEDDDEELHEPDLVFAFRRESDATLFALKWSTATM